MRVDKEGPGEMEAKEDLPDLPSFDIPLPRFARPQQGAGGLPSPPPASHADKPTAGKNRWASARSTASAGSSASPEAPFPPAGQGLPPGIQLHCREAPFVRGDGVLIFREDPVYRTVTVGYFNERTRTSQATTEVMALMKLLGLEEEVQEILPAPPTCRVVKLLMLNRMAAGDTIKKLKDLRASTENSVGILWASRGQTQEDQARSGPLRRAVRMLHDERERRHQRGDAAAEGPEHQAHLRPDWTPEAFYAPGREAVYIRWEKQNLEEKLIFRGKTGAWEVNDMLYDHIGGVRGEAGGRMEARAFLAGLL